MRLFVRAFILWFLLFGSVYSQDSYSNTDSPFTVMVNGGLTLSNLSSNGFNVQDQLFGNLRQSFQSGAALEFNLTPNLRVRSGFQYASLGGKSDEQIQTDTEGRELQQFRIEEKQHYVEIPIQVKYLLMQHGYQPYIVSGFTIGFLASARLDLDSEVEGISSFSDDDISDSRNSTAFGLDLAAGVQIPIRAALGLDIGGVYNIGLSNQFKPADDDRSLKLRSWRFLLGLYMAI